ncbi:MAG TPA: endonuclease/exonuclease/phosphatase family protein [Anaerohalosphaeraceae bacterium]|nr:endonuclease/exonuclease/phosphatase family protein [Anaerohalosphaeraceae bacterium]
MRILLWCGLITAAFFGCQKSSQKTEKAASGAIQSETLKAVTFNIRYGTAEDGPNRWDRRRESVFTLLAEYGADVLALQEALDFQVEQIGRALPAYDYVFVCRDDGKRAGESCPIFYRKDRFERLDTGTFWFSDTPDIPGSKHWGNQIPRICTWICLRERTSRRPLWIYNVHLDHQSQSSREKSIQLLAEKIMSLPAGSAVIVLGDFNMDLLNPALEPLLSEQGPALRDAWQTLFPDRQPVGTWHDFGRRLNTAKIDHILLPQGLSVLQAEIDQRTFEGHYPSDHFPVWAVIQWPPKSAEVN